ncbi:hypothetical protein, partial [Micrococcus luteus]|uniref:hypothetical protein n=1 Tax=Micrococcus luteus TaxID=1270 RepID=UPI001C92F1FC
MTVWVVVGVEETGDERRGVGERAEGVGEEGGVVEGVEGGVGIGVVIGEGGCGVGRGEGEVGEKRKEDGGVGWVGGGDEGEEGEG